MRPVQVWSGSPPSTARGRRTQPSSTTPAWESRHRIEAARGAVDRGRGAAGASTSGSARDAADKNSGGKALHNVLGHRVAGDT
ncbi:MAG: hypothetical protein ACK53Y_15455, partial [bacterium]